jgi:2-dehydro-3-deoxyphosphogluconate aldolase/(4S)-4-hydroxy-2-oxoglutarate aldolase
MNAFEVIKRDRIVVVIRGKRVADLVGLVNALTSAGIRSIEFTFTMPDVLEAIEASANSHANIGAGTVLNTEQARRAIEAGAAFIVSPALRPEIVEVSNAHSIPVILGGFTTSEILAAHEAGSIGVKLFPARIGGPAYVKDLLGPLPDVALLPSGGVGEANARDYLDAGAVAVYSGSSLAPPVLVESGQYDEIARRAEALVAAVG